MNQPDESPAQWSRSFLTRMVGIMLVSPVAGGLLGVFWGLLNSPSTSWEDTALNAAKICGIAGGFAAPFIALWLTAREISRGVPDMETDQSRSPARNVRSENPADH